MSTPYTCPVCEGSGVAPAPVCADKWGLCMECHGLGTLIDPTVVQPIYRYEVHSS